MVLVIIPFSVLVMMMVFKPEQEKSQLAFKTQWRVVNGVWLIIINLTLSLQGFSEEEEILDAEALNGIKK